MGNLFLDVPAAVFAKTCLSAKTWRQDSRTTRCAKQNKGTCKNAARKHVSVRSVRATPETILRQPRQQGNHGSKTSHGSSIQAATGVCSMLPGVAEGLKQQRSVLQSGQYLVWEIHHPKEYQKRDTEEHITKGRSMAPSLH